VGFVTQKRFFVTCFGYFLSTQQRIVLVCHLAHIIAAADVRLSSLVLTLLNFLHGFGFLTLMPLGRDICKCPSNFEVHLSGAK